MRFMYYHRIYLEHYYWQNWFDLDSLEPTFSLQLALVHLQLAYKAK